MRSAGGRLAGRDYDDANLGRGLTLLSVGAVIIGGGEFGVDKMTIADLEARKVIEEATGVSAR